MSKTRRGRLKQIERWLNAKFPPSRPTTVKITDLWHGKKAQFGDCDRTGNKILIRIHSKLTWHVAIYALFEEWAHAMTWPLASVENYKPHHGPEFGLAYASILHEFYDNEGYLESRTYSDK